MKFAYPLFCVAALGACDSTSIQTMSSLTGALKAGMTEQQVAEVSNNRVPDRVVMATCGIDTPKPFACRSLSTEDAPGRPVRSEAFRLLEDVEWKVSQWL